MLLLPPTVLIMNILYSRLCFHEPLFYLMISCRMLSTILAS